MEKYKKYTGLILFIVIVLLAAFGAYSLVMPKYNEVQDLESKLQSKQQELDSKKAEKQRVEAKLKKLQDSISNSQKKIYAPVESDLGNDSLFFTLYNDLLEMIHANSIKIKSIDYSYSPASDNFVKNGNGEYFVCEVKMELVSNYVNIGKLVQDIYQYPYYIKMNELDIKPYEKDKTVLIANLSLNLYSRTAPVEDQDEPEIQEEE